MRWVKGFRVKYSEHSRGIDCDNGIYMCMLAIIFGANACLKQGWGGGKSAVAQLEEH